MNEEVELSTLCRKFRMKGVHGRYNQTEGSNIEGILRIVQSIPSPQAEPFKRWLARVGYERIQEVEQEGEENTE